jgi:O-antigen/teichoic acid export membrane protein
LIPAARKLPHMADENPAGPAQGGGLRARRLVHRVVNTGVFWYWGTNALRLGSGFLLFPLLWRLLTTEELGFYYILMQLMGAVVLLDLGLSVSINRFVSYAMGGAKEFVALGLPSGPPASGQPNYQLVWRLLHTSRRLYGWMALLFFLVLGGVGTALVSLRVDEAPNPALAWLAWVIALASATYEMYSGWWNTFLRSINEVIPGARYACFGYGLRLVLAGLLLLAGVGLLSVPIACGVSSLVIRHLSRRLCLKKLTPHADPVATQEEMRTLLRILWPTSWRAGLQFSTSYFGALAGTFILVKVFRLAGNAEYGLSLQIAGLIQAMSQTWVSVKWPVIGQLRAQHDLAALRRLLRPRVQLLTLTFVLMAACAWAFGQPLLHWIGSNKKMLPHGWFAVLLVNAFLEVHIVFWTTLLSLENRIPSLWPVVITTVAGLGLVVALVQFTSLGLASFVVAPLLAGSVFNYWYWPYAGARSLDTTWLRFMFGRNF